MLGLDESCMKRCRSDDASKNSAWSCTLLTQTSSHYIFVYSPSKSTRFCQYFSREKCWHQVSNEMNRGVCTIVNSFILLSLGQHYTITWHQFYRCWLLLQYTIIIINYYTLTNSCNVIPCSVSYLSYLQYLMSLKELYLEISAEDMNNIILNNMNMLQTYFGGCWWRCWLFSFVNFRSGMRICTSSWISNKYRHTLMYYAVG